MRQAPVGMVEVRTTPYQGKATGWPQSQPARRARKRRDSKVMYYNNNLRCSPPRYMPVTSKATVLSNPAYAFDQMTLRPTDQMCSRPELQQQRYDQNGMGYRNIQEGVDGNYELNPAPQPVSQAGPPWQSSSLVSYTLASGLPASPPFYTCNDFPPGQDGFYLHVANEVGEGWSDVGLSNNVNPDQSGISALDIPFGSFGSMDSLPGSTPTSPDSDGYIYPLMTTGIEPGQELNPVSDLDLSDAYFQIGQSIYPPLSGQQDPNSLYQDAIYLGNDGLQVQMDINPANSAFSDSQWSLIDDNMAKHNYNMQPVPIPHIPWTSEQLPLSGSQSEEGSETATFDLQQIAVQQKIACESNNGNEEYADNHAFKNEFICHETAATPPGESDNDSWIIPFDPKNYTPTHSSPGSSRSVRSQTSSPRQNELDSHGHVFTSFSGISKPKISKGRQRNLTQLEKRQAREVRDAKACWACHISKTKCSPCSPGSPCEQCARLVGKRRFCKFDCFNDPLESLYIFLVPDYLNSHFTRQDVESFIAKNAKGWGNKRFFVRMDWGHRRFLEAEVVALELRSERSEMAFHHSTKRDGLGKPLPTLVKQQSPPLGIPLAAMDDMEDKYSKYVRDIVQSDLGHYVPVGYFADDSELAKRLLEVVSSFYAMGVEADSECEILRQAIEMHVTSMILEKSLSLDRESTNRVENHLQQRYSGKPVARCAQRQIKLALFQSQQKRINKVLKDWGNMMWTIGNAAGNNNKWAVSFSVFLILTLVMDKISAAAQIFCEDQIRYYGAEPEAERAKFRELMKVTETQLFDRCKEIFHWKFKTRKGGKEACNPIRDGMEAFKGRPVSREITQLTFALQSVVREFGKEIRSHSSLGGDQETPPYADVGRLASIFLDDFLDH